MADTKNVQEVKKTKTNSISKEEHDAVVEELEKTKNAYAELAEAFNKLLKEYNELHVALLFKK